MSRTRSGFHPFGNRGAADSWPRSPCDGLDDEHVEVVAAGDLLLDAEDGGLELLYQHILFSALPLHEVQNMLPRVGVWFCGDPAILEDLCAGGRGEVGAFFDCDNEGLVRGDQAGLLDPGAVMPKAMGAIVFAMLGCNDDVR